MLSTQKRRLMMISKKLIKDHHADLHRDKKSKVNAKKIFDLTAAAKADNNPDAMVELARMLSGDEPCQSYLWYKKAADEHSHLRGMEKAGECQVKGLGTPHDPKGGMELLEKAAKEGSGIAAYRIGVWRYDGSHGVKRNYRKAEKWLKAASKNCKLDHKCRKEAYKYLEKIEDKLADDVKFSPII